eukprot:m.106612 g.106612  ORF g.106612 m.106612 type:complete len:81 (+) comp37262_c0_seq43:75-317(+)
MSQFPGVVDFPQKQLLACDEFEYNESADYIGGGGFAEVYKAKMTSTNEVVAAKVFVSPSRLEEEKVGGGSPSPAQPYVES